jgi:putative flippase GtrA
VIAARSQVARAFRFVGVGVLGFVLQLIALGLLLRAGCSLTVATATAVMVTAVHNYFWHEQLTWSDRARSRRWSRLLRYLVAGNAVALAGNIFLTAIYCQLLHVPAVAANAMAVGTLAVVNFGIADRWVFRARTEDIAPGR